MPARPTTLYPRATVYFSIVLVVVVIGFFPSYFAVLGTTDRLHHFHGLTATAWMLLLVLQSWLANHRFYALHRAFGRFSLLLAPAFVVSGLLMIQFMLASRLPFSRAFGPRLAMVDLVMISSFTGAYALAVWFRRNIGLHARFMACTAILPLPPALSRLFGHLIPAFTSFEASFHAGYLVTEAIILLLLLNDRHAKKMRLPYTLLLATVLLQQAGFMLLAHLPQWEALLTPLRALR